MEIIITYYSLLSYLAALAFMQCSGSRGSRSQQAVKSIGPAVLNGGFSTFLAILLLANSQSHAFKSFFKVKRISYRRTECINYTQVIKTVLNSELFFITDIHSCDMFRVIPWFSVSSCSFGPYWATTLFEYSSGQRRPSNRSWEKSVSGTASTGEWNSKWSHSGGVNIP